MSEMVERVAKALYSEYPEDWDDALRIVNKTFGGDGFMNKHPDTWANYKAEVDEARGKARRAIEAMREPTEAMCMAADALDTISGGVLMTPIPAKAWEAMIDEALK